MGECDTETLGKYVLVSSAGYFESLGVIVDEDFFIENVDDIQKRQLETIKHVRCYQQKEGQILLYQDIMTKRYEIFIGGSTKQAVIGDLEKIISQIKKCKEKLDREKDNYDDAIRSLKKEF